MIVKTVRVSDKGQIAIPKEIRERTGIKKGEELLVFQREGQILLERLERVSTLAQEDLEAWQSLAEGVAKKVWDNKKDERWGEELLAHARRGRAGALFLHRPSGKQGSPSTRHRSKR